MREDFTAFNAFVSAKECLYIKNGVDLQMETFLDPCEGMGTIYGTFEAAFFPCRGCIMQAVPMTRTSLS